jgi:hypothetical protein
MAWRVRYLRVAHQAILHLRADFSATSPAALIRLC